MVRGEKIFEDLWYNKFSLLSVDTTMFTKARIDWNPQGLQGSSKKMREVKIRRMKSLISIQ